ncbi:hypothetical protein ACQKL5_17965 [Peribacillus sp. NPDC097675]|uniref:hypothetical protein n=1 Tax=Peribacillus sp. NPDC097675 TaxID=3390618 RepID=UPI003CFED21D
MIDAYARELRNIRITLIVFIIITIVVSGDSNNLTLDYPDDDGSGMNVYPQFKYSNMVDLGNGHFGVLSGRTELSEEETFKIYYYDIEKDELVLKKDTVLSDLE